MEETFNYYLENNILLNDKVLNWFVLEKAQKLGLNDYVKKVNFKNESIVGNYNASSSEISLSSSFNKNNENMLARLSKTDQRVYKEHFPNLNIIAVINFSRLFTALHEISHANQYKYIDNNGDWYSEIISVSLTIQIFNE
jgi:hypothetical protein